jgi:hypothetical protein
VFYKKSYLIGPKDFSTFSIYKTYAKYKTRWREMELRLSIILALVLTLSACSAYAFGAPGSVVVDIVGSVTDNTTITSSGMERVELEIIGSWANNTTITMPAENVAICPKYICPYINYYPELKCECDEKSYPWENMHRGVDAWYGTFLYTGVNMPKWPKF